MTGSKLIGVSFAGVKDSSLGETRLDHNLDFNNKNPTKLIGRIHIHADKLVGLEVLVSERIEVFDRNDRMRQLQHRIEKTNKTNFVSLFAEDLAESKINPRANSDLH